MYTCYRLPLSCFYNFCPLCCLPWVVFFFSFAVLFRPPGVPFLSHQRLILCGYPPRHRLLRPSRILCWPTAQGGQFPPLIKLGLIHLGQRLTRCKCHQRSQLAMAWMSRAQFMSARKAASRIVTGLCREQLVYSSYALLDAARRKGPANPIL